MKLSDSGTGVNTRIRIMHKIHAWDMPLFPHTPPHFWKSCESLFFAWLINCQKKRSFLWLMQLPIFIPVKSSNKACGTYSGLIAFWWMFDYHGFSQPSSHSHSTTDDHCLIFLTPGVNAMPLCWHFHSISTLFGRSGSYDSKFIKIWLLMSGRVVSISHNIKLLTCKWRYKSNMLSAV